MRKGIQPALQIMRIVSPDGRLWEVLTPRIYKSDKRYRSLPQEEEAKQREGQLARFRRRYGDSYLDDDDDSVKRISSKRPWRDGAGKDEDED